MQKYSFAQLGMIGSTFLSFWCRNKACQEEGSQTIYNKTPSSKPKICIFDEFSFNDDRRRRRHRRRLRHTKNVFLCFEPLLPIPRLWGRPSIHPKVEISVSFDRNRLANWKIRAIAFPLVVLSKIKQKQSESRAVVLAELVQRSLPTPEIHGSAPVIGNFYVFTVNCI